MRPLRNRLDCGLPVLRRIADIGARRLLNPVEPLLERRHHACGLIHAQRGLCEQYQLLPRLEIKVRDITFMFNQMNMLRRLPHHADRLIMPTMTDIDDFVAFTDEPRHFTMDFAHQRAGRIDDEHAAPFGFRLHLRRYAMR